MTKGTESYILSLGQSVKINGGYIHDGHAHYGGSYHSHTTTQKYKEPDTTYDRGMMIITKQRKQ